MFNTLILLIIYIAALALVGWGAKSMGFPAPVVAVINVILGLVALMLIYNAFFGGGLSFGRGALR